MTIIIVIILKAASRALQSGAAWSRWAPGAALDPQSRRFGGRRHGQIRLDGL